MALCRLDAITDPGGKGFDYRAAEALFAGVVVRRGGRVFGYVDRCPHADFPLALAPDRYLTRDGQRILCAGHGAVFRLEDGVCTGGPCAGDRLEPWPVTLDQDGVVRTA